MAPTTAFLGLLLGVLVAASMGFGGSSPPVRTSLQGAEITAPVNASANFAGWTWFGTGAPCEAGSHLTYVAHFFGNASGGEPPYRFAWNFGDGSPLAGTPNATHVFLSGAGGWTVDLTATDSAGTNGTASVQVSLPVFSCPAEAPGPSSPWQLLLVVFFLPATAITVGVSVVLLWTRLRRRP